MTHRTILTLPLFVFLWGCQNDPIGGEFEFDEDRDGYEIDVDCDDKDPNTFPEATEFCDGKDNDCDLMIDEDDALGAAVWYRDEDGDGHGLDEDTVTSCEQPIGFVSLGADCDDNNEDVSPSAIESCNLNDDDCDGEVDEDAGSQRFVDGDGDGFGDDSRAYVSCDEADPGALVGGDCDDNTIEVFPGADEACDGFDNDCDGLVDDEDSDVVGAPQWYTDGDEDGYGVANDVIIQCNAPGKLWASQTGDCDDTDSTINPDSLEVCDGVDNDCDFVTDNGDAWLTGGWQYRIPVTVTAGDVSLPSHPYNLVIDTGDPGLPAGLDLESLKLVHQDCGGPNGMVEIPAQVLLGVRGLSEDEDMAWGLGDGIATVVFLYDTDGDYTTAEGLPAETAADLMLYFEGNGESSSFEGDLAVTESSLSTGFGDYTFDNTNGGLLSSATIESSPVLANQAATGGGNGLYNGSEWANPGVIGSQWEVQVISEGPIVGIRQVLGQAVSDETEFSYIYTYWQYTYRPELWIKVRMETLISTPVFQYPDFTRGIRPFQTNHDALMSGATLSYGQDLSWGDVSNGTWGFAVGYVFPPTYLTHLAVEDSDLYTAANDIYDLGMGTDGVLDAGVRFIDNAHLVALPHQGSFDAVAPEFGALLAGQNIILGTIEIP